MTGKDLPPLTVHEAKAILAADKTLCCDEHFGTKLAEHFKTPEVIAAWDRLLDSAVARVKLYEGTVPLRRWLP